MIKEIKHYVTRHFALAALGLSAIGINSCEMFEVHPYDTQVKGEKNLNQRASDKLKKPFQIKTPYVLPLSATHSVGMTRPKTLFLP